MVDVFLSPQAIRQLHRLPGGMVRRVNDALARLAGWPAVSGVKPLRGALKGHYRIRCGDWRIVVRLVGKQLLVSAIDNRRDVYR